MAEEKQKKIISKDKLLEAGVYFGHRKSMRNPKMNPYISRIQKGTQIIDIEKTRRALQFAYDLIKNYADRGASFMFVGTRKQAKETIKENALRTNSYYVSERWLGGTFTNSKTIFQRVRRMEQLEKLAAKQYEGYTKKEGLLFDRELHKLHRNLQGIRNMRRRPNIMIIADPAHDDIAVKEAKKLGVRTIGIVDTNNDPSVIDVAIPANDDSQKSVTLIMTILADAIAFQKGGEQLFAFQDDSKIVLPVDLKKETMNKTRRNNFRGGFDNKRNYRPAQTRPASERPAQTRPASERPIINKEAKVIAETKAKPEVKKVVVAETTKAKPETKKPKVVASNEKDKVVPAIEDTASLKVSELKEIAKTKKIDGYSKMKKAELVEALEK